MNLTFYKYQGTGNDFVMIDNRTNFFPKNNTKLIAFLCDRRFGIGADGLILLENHEHYDFKMVYYNSDGNESSMCGNGGRCLVAFAKQLNIIWDKADFEAIDGYHYATIDEINKVSLQMKDVDELQVFENYTFLNTGSPHHVEAVTDLAQFDVKTIGAQIRYSDLYGKAGSNVNFVEQIDSDKFAVRTYERGVEDETLSCGTGVTAVAIAMYHNQFTNSNKVNLKVEGGDLEVNFEANNGKYTHVFLTGPAKYVFEGTIEIEAI
ncbi:diaminopimelate epimerase [Flavobacterium sp. NRK F7]|uniref:diaminopimelate epimerase n=1 Tax=Flavobacterium sp. NRK F7 TaxID=2954930 RepID=UPI0020919604|nr:diaminopimelate epimerase [Flavobacterium sp. NRK F7]MCO6162723.1 diaminopimelate epimerase [Flavobacterium sp. NRK F7]